MCISCCYWVLDTEFIRHCLTNSERITKNKTLPARWPGVPVQGLFFRKFTISGFKPFIKTLFRNPVNGADPDPTEFVPFQETVSGFAANTQYILQILNSVATVSRGRFGLNRAHHDFVLLSVSVYEWGRTLKQHNSTAGFVGCVPTDAPTRKKTDWDDKHQIGTGCTNWFHMGMSFLQTGTIRHGNRICETMKDD